MDVVTILQSFWGQQKKRKICFHKNIKSNMITTGMANEYFGLIRLLIISVMTFKIILSLNFSKKQFST
jgi:hypothetical protein